MLGRKRVLPVVIRKAKPSDLCALLRFQQGVVRAERPFDPTLKDGVIEYYDIARMLESEHVEFVIATSADAAVGCGFARIEASKPYLRHAQHAYVGLMYVEPEYRRAGVNAKILAWLEQWCRARRVSEMRLEVYHANEAAIRAYGRAGFSPLELEMRKPLQDD